MILLLGASGYIGRALVRELRQRNQPFVPLSRQDVDYSHFGALFNHVRALKPSFIINAAGHVGSPPFEGCEPARAEAVRANTLLPQTIARVCYLTRIPLGHVSSGSIYSGARVNENGAARIERDLARPEIERLYESRPEVFQGFTETDAPNFCFRAPPCSFYSGTKALAEEGLTWFESVYVWRPGPLFDETDHCRNLLSRIQRAPEMRPGVTSLTHRGDFVRACLDLWTGGAPFGTYHMTNPGAATGRQLAEMVRRFGKPPTGAQRLDSTPPDSVIAGSAAVPHCILDTAKLAAAGVRMRPVQDALEDSLRRWQSAPAGLHSMENAVKSS